MQRVDGRLIIKGSKTEKSQHALTLPAAAVDALRLHHDRQKFGGPCAAIWYDQGLIFANTRGGPPEPSKLPKRFKVTLAAAGVPEQLFHDLQHYAASFLLAQGVPMRVVMDILGQSQMVTTADLYSHVMPAAHQDVADLLDRAMLAQS